MIEANIEQPVNYCPNSDRASSTSLKNKVSSMLSSCRICLSGVFDPASLTCGHMFCEQCINKYWQSTDKPDFIVCPLCRARASNIAFVRKEDPSSTEELRKMFKLADSDASRTTSFCLKISILVPMFYFMVKWLRYPLLGLLNYFQIKIATMYDED